MFIQLLISLSISATTHTLGLNQTTTDNDSTRNKLQTTNDDPVDPVVIVPGIFGSQLDARWNKTSAPHLYCYKSSPAWTTLWLCFQCMVPKVIDCWVDNMLLNFTENTFQNRDGVETKVNDFGGTGGVENIDKNGYYPYMKAVVDGIAAIPGYERGVNLRAAPYDFRYGANSPTGQLYLKNLRTLIEDTYETNNGRRINILAHSMGNLYMIQFFKSVSSSWKHKYIKRYIAISGVFGGSVKSLRALVSGEIESIPRVLVDANAVRAFQRSFQSIYWLLPRKQLWNDTEPIIFTPDRNYTVHDYADLLDDAGFPDGREILKTLEGSTDLTDPGVDVYCLHGSEIPTAAQFRWKPKYFPDYQPNQIDGPGDGTVNQRSLEQCKKFKRLKDHKVYPGIKFGEHMQILLNPDVIQYVKDLILETDEQGKVDLVF
ncbi:phospholipase A2 group XV-like [Bolinopsis microptera]|uniref:phospholipase A2 group XV-like n=1 Tax=Bolinopsis microptera TaxID=2820187 RepID=UPI00307A8D6F